MILFGKVCIRLVMDLKRRPVLPRNSAPLVSETACSARPLLLLCVRVTASGLTTSRRLIRAGNTRPALQKLARTVSPRVVVDVGCGLGEVLAHIKAERRYGLDIDKTALDAARFWHSRKIVFGEGSFFDAASIASAIREPEISLMIMNNWVHGCDFETFKKGILEIKALKPVHYILFDTFRPGYDPTYYSYSLDELSSLGRILSIVPAGRGRDLFLLQLA